LGAPKDEDLNKDGVIDGADERLSLEEQEERTNLVTSLIGAIALAAGIDASQAITSARIETENNAIKTVKFSDGGTVTICVPNTGCKGKTLAEMFRLPAGSEGRAPLDELIKQYNTTDPEELNAILNLLEAGKSKTEIKNKIEEVRDQVVANAVAAGVGTEEEARAIINKQGVSALEKQTNSAVMEQALADLPEGQRAAYQESIEKYDSDENRALDPRAFQQKYSAERTSAVQAIYNAGPVSAELVEALSLASHLGLSGAELRALANFPGAQLSSTIPSLRANAAKVSKNPVGIVAAAATVGALIIYANNNPVTEVGPLPPLPGFSPTAPDLKPEIYPSDSGADTGNTESFPNVSGEADGILATPVEPLTTPPLVTPLPDPAGPDILANENIWQESGLPAKPPQLADVTGTPQDRRAEITVAWREYAESNGLEQDPGINRKNPGRDIYRLSNGDYISVDFRHGTAELLDKKGKHQGEIKQDGSLDKSKKDDTGGHDIKI
jgi:hypothetical protein